MKIRLSQLRRIIKEEVNRTLRQTVQSSRRLREAPELEGDGELEAQLEVPNISSHAEGLEMTPEEFCAYIRGLAAEFKGIEFGGLNALVDDDGYSEEHDSLIAFGSEKDLVNFAKKLDREMMGGAQSMSAEDSFVNLVEPI